MTKPQKTVQQNLALQILLADELVKSAKEVQPSKFDCSDLADLADQLTYLLRSTARLVASSTTFYDRPLRAIFPTVSFNLERAQALVRKCKNRRGILRHVFAITTAADIQKVSNLLESSVADLKWFLSIFLPEDNINAGVNLSLPPIASNDAVLAWVWSNIATVQHSPQLKDRVDAANLLGSLAGNSDRNKKVIVEEDGIPPLLKLLKEGASLDSQIAAASTLYHLATDQEKVAACIRSLAVPTIVKVLNDSTCVLIRTNVISLVSRMAEIDPCAQEEFGRENVLRPIVTFLASDIVFSENDKTYHSPSIRSLVRANSEISKSNIPVNIGTFRSNSSLSSYNKKETDLGSPEEKLKLKITCGRALRVLAKGSLLNSRKITETKALICLAKLIEHENEELQLTCLKTVMELAAVAESNADLRRQAFKPNSLAALTLLNHLLRVTSQESNPKLVGPAITTIGSLARTFPVKETRILGPLVSKLQHEDTGIANEAVKALTKFVCPENFNCVEHSKVILEFDGVPHLMNLMKRNNNSEIQVHGVKLLCYLALHVGNSKALEQARALTVIEDAARSVLTQHPAMEELFAKVIHHLNLYQGGTLTHKHD